jgi:hypothetical protein
MRRAEIVIAALDRRVFNLPRKQEKNADSLLIKPFFARGQQFFDFVK